MKVLILLISLLFTSLALAVPTQKEPEVKNSMELFNKLNAQPREDQPVQPNTSAVEVQALEQEAAESTTQKQARSISKIQQERIWSLDKIAKKFKPEDLNQARLDISLESAPERSQRMKVFKVTRVASGSIYEKAGVQVGDYVAQ